MKRDSASLLMIGCALMLFLAVLPFPIGYYTFLRIVVSIGSIVALIRIYNGAIDFWIVVFGILILLFNPIIPIYFGDKNIWIPIDFIAGILFTVFALSTRDRK